MGYKIVCSKCGAVLAEYNPKNYAGIASADSYKGAVCPSCGYMFKGKIKRILVDGEIIYP